MQAILKYIKENLEGLYHPTEISSLTRIIMENVTGLSVPMIISDKSKKITPNEKAKIVDIVNRLKQSEPIQYILGETEFYGLIFSVNKNVLIPRPETEELIELIVNENKDKGSVNVLDIGTGSGCIAISLKKQLPQTIVTAWDISDEALIVAKNNAVNNNADIRFSKIDVLAEYPEHEKYDIIVSNPPYVLESEKQNMENNVLEYEPHLALFVPDEKALLFYERIADIALKILNNNGHLYFEINACKGKEVAEMLEKKGFNDIVLTKDLSKKDRIVKATI